MSKYQELKGNPFKPSAVESKQLNKKTDMLQVTLVSCMCDNISYLKVRRTSGFHASVTLSNDSHGLTLSNLQMQPNAKEEIRWAFLDGNLDEVLRIISTGTRVVSSIKIRGGEEENKNEGYSFYLFSMLWNDMFKDIEYDISYPLVQKDFAEFGLSRFNTSDISEYECILDFLHDKQRTGE